MSMQAQEPRLKITSIFALRFTFASKISASCTPNIKLSTKNLCYFYTATTIEKDATLGGNKLWTLLAGNQGKTEVMGGQSIADPLSQDYRFC